MVKKKSSKKAVKSTPTPLYKDPGSSSVEGEENFLGLSPTDTAPTTAIHATTPTALPTTSALPEDLDQVPLNQRPLMQSTDPTEGISNTPINKKPNPKIFSGLKKDTAMPISSTPKSKPLSFKDVQFANAIKVGHNQETYVNDDLYAITLDGNNVRVESRRTRAVSYTTLFNVIWWRRL